MNAKELLIPERARVQKTYLIAAVILSLAFGSTSTVAAQELHCYAGWTAAYKCMEHCGPCPNDGANRPSRVYVPPPQPAPPDPAIAAIADGDAATARQDWDAAIAAYQKALQSRPNDAAILASLRNAMDRRQMEMDAQIDSRDAAALQALRQRIEDQTGAALLQSLLNNVEDESAAQRLNAIYDNARLDPSIAVAPAVRMNSADLWRSYPVFAHPVPANSPPLKVIAQLQPQVRDLDREIRQAQEALRRLIASNSVNDEEREFWVRQSEEATVDAQDLSLSLLIDLLGARADELSAQNHQKREVVMDRLIAECDRNGPSPRIVNGYESLVGTKHDLERLHQEIRLAGKENDLRVRIRDFSMDHAEPNLEIVWDVMSQFEIVENLTGPWADMLNASYTIYRQATAAQHLALFQSNDEKTYQASQTLLALIAKLRDQKASLEKQNPIQSAP